MSSLDTLTVAHFSSFQQDMFYSLEAGLSIGQVVTVIYRTSLSLHLVLKRFLDIDHLISLLVMVPKRDTQKSAESTITNVSLAIGR